MFLILISILPVLLVGAFIYKKDKDREPIGLILKLFIGGVVSIFITYILSDILMMISPIFDSETIKNLDFVSLFVAVFVGIAFVEEFSKWIVLYVISYNHKEFDQLYDMIVYATFVALGFACFENIFYVLDGGLTTGVVRAFTAVPGHACDGILMGYYLGLAKINEVNNNLALKSKNMWLSLIIPIIAHGIYDYLLFLNNVIFALIFLLLLIIFFIFILKKIKKISNVTGKFNQKTEYCSRCGNIVNSNFCSCCGNKIKR